MPQRHLNLGMKIENGYPFEGQRQRQNIDKVFFFKKFFVNTSTGGPFLIDHIFFVQLGVYALKFWLKKFIGTLYKDHTRIKAPKGQNGTPAENLKTIPYLVEHTCITNIWDYPLLELQKSPMILSSL